VDETAAQKQERERQYLAQHAQPSKQNAGIRGLAVSVASVALALEKVSAQAKATTADVVEFVSMRDRIEQYRSERSANALDALLSGPATGAMMSIYIETLAINPSDPSLPRIKNFFRQFAKVDESLFSEMEKLFRDARRNADRNRGNRGKRLDQGTIDDILNEVKGQ